MQKYSDVVLDKSGKAINGATITVITYPDGQPATIYAADGGPAVAFVLTDQNGRFAFYAANGHYSFAVNGTGITPINYNDVTLFDPNEYRQTGAGAIKRGAFDKLQESISVADYLAAGDPDDSLSFQRAIDALPALGGKILVPAKSYVLATTPAPGAKSIHWDISTAATFTGAGTGQNKFPSMRTNGGQIAVGPYIQSQSRIPYTLSNGGVAAFQAEMIQPADVVGQSVALYAGAQGSNANAGANVWAINALINAAAGAGGTYQGIELDVDCFSDAALVKGLSINGVGSANPDVGIELIRTDATRWNVGVDIMQAITGIKVRNTSGLTQGVIVGDPSAQPSAAASFKQLVNGGETLMLQRFTDTSPSGYLIRGVDGVNSTTLFHVDAYGAIFGAGGTFKADSSTGLNALVMENASTAGVTTKTITMVARGRDTINSLKNTAEIVVAPTNSNLTGSTITFRARASDAMADTLSLDASGNALVMRVGAGLRVKEGSNAKQGTATLVGGTVTVANTSVTANSRIFLTSQSDGGTPGFLRVSARVAGTSFTITSGSASDTSTVAYEIFEPA
jgi:hypothetical protein